MPNMRMAITHVNPNEMDVDFGTQRLNLLRENAIQIAIPNAIGTDVKRGIDFAGNG